MVAPPVTDEQLERPVLIARLRRLVDGMTPPGPGPWPEPSGAVVEAMALRAWWRQWELARPLPPPLDRLDAHALAALRARPLRAGR